MLQIIYLIIFTILLVGAIAMMSIGWQVNREIPTKIKHPEEPSPGELVMGVSFDDSDLNADLRKRITQLQSEVDEQKNKITDDNDDDDDNDDGGLGTKVPALV